MKKTLRSGTQEVEAFGLWKERAAENEREVPEWNASHRFLRGFLGDPMAMRTLREGLARRAPYLQPSQMDDHELLRQVSSRMLAEPDSVGISVRQQTVLSGGSKKKEEAQSAGTGAPTGIKPADPKTWIKFQVIDADTSIPIAGVALIVKDPSGWLKEYTTDSRGIVEIKNIDKGAFEARGKRDGARLPQTLAFVSISPGDEIKQPATQAESNSRILKVENHKVHTGESILSLATANGMTWQDLSDFNWGTHVPTEINKHLAADVGCTKKTKDGYNYMFDDGDDPGVMFIPSDWTASGLGTEKTHLIHVRIISTRESRDWPFSV